VLGVPVNELLWLALLIIAGGVITGLLAGLFGIGGGGVIVPVLYEVFGHLGVQEDVRMQLCIGTSIAIIVPTTVRSYVMHKSKGAALTDVVRQWTIPAVIGVIVGAVIAAFAPSAVFKVAFILFTLTIATKMIFGSDKWQIADELPSGPLMWSYGGLIGLASSLIGVSGGSISNLILSLYGKPIHNAVATSAGIGVPITIIGTIGYALAGWPHMAALPPFSVGFISLIGLIVMAPVSSFSAGYGALLAHRLSKRALELGFATFLLLVGARFVAALVF